MTYQSILGRNPTLNMVYRGPSFVIRTAKVTAYSSDSYCEWLEWTDRGWRKMLHEEHYIPYDPLVDYPPSEGDTSRTLDRTPVVLSGWRMKNILYKRFLLTSNEVPDIFHTSPQEMEQIAKGIPEDVMIERLRRYLRTHGEKYKTISGWAV